MANASVVWVKGFSLTWLVQMLEYDHWRQSRLCQKQCHKRLCYCKYGQV